MEDEDLGNGYEDYLSGTEIKFFREMIAKYLMPFEEPTSPCYVSPKESEQTREELFEYRDSFIFSFLIINLLYIAAVTLFQVKDNLNRDNGDCLFNIQHIKNKSI